MAELTDALYIQKLYEEFKRLERKRQVIQKVLVTEGGTVFKHGLGVTPRIVIPLEQGEFTVYEYKPRDAKHIYLKSSATGYVMLTVIGD